MADTVKAGGDNCFDVAVLGAGPAGTNAAIEAARHGLSVVLVDDAVAAGGQVWRAPSTATALRLSEGEADRVSGDSLRSRLARSAVHVLDSAVVWSVIADDIANNIVEDIADDIAENTEAYRFRIELHRHGQLLTVHARRLVAALGAVERVIPFPGWTLPGVFGLAAATVMLKRDGCLPGRQIAVAGQGPLLVAVAAKSLAAGVKPRLVIDAARLRDWAQASIGFAASFSQLFRGIRWTGTLIKAKIPHAAHSAVIAAYGERQLEAIEVAPLNSSGEPLTDQSYRIPVDTLFVGNGLSPVAEVPRLLGADVRQDVLQGGFSVVHDAFGRTSIPGLLVAGDGAGIRGAQPSSLAGTLAGLACAHDAGRLSLTVMNRSGQSLRRRYRRAELCADASCRLMQVPVARMAAIPDETIICRCELVNRAAIEKAASEGVRRINELKTETRLGMGPCQGRMCALNAAALLAIANGEKANLDLLTQRIPLRPLPVDQLTGCFTYDDIPVPAPAPL